jgi:putative transposase
MTLSKNTFRIESTRLKGYDYSQPGKYFVTIYTNNHECLFGTVEKEEMMLSPISIIAKKRWEEIPCHHKNVALDEFIVMPNHVHGIIILLENSLISAEETTESASHRDAIHRVSMDEINESKLSGRDVACNVSTKTMISPKRGSLGTVIRSYKSAVSYWCHVNGHDDFAWQPRFHEHIIRNEKDLNNTRDYIVNNPLKWFYNDEHPTQKK